MFDTVMHWLGFGLCHQLPARSFFAGGHQLPVCARDTGIYVGFIVALAVIALLERGRHRTGAPPAWLMGVGAAFVLALLWDGVTSYAGLRETTNLLRLATGTGTGFALTLAVVPILNAQLWDRNGSGRVLGAPLEGAVWCLAVPVTVLALWWGGPLMGVGYPLLVAVAVIVTFSAVNLIVVSLVPRFERRAGRLRDAWPAMLIAVAATLLELAVADWLRVALSSLVSQR
jgi:uncharacterized membrane protein